MVLDNRQQVVSYILNNTNCKDLRNANTSLNKALKTATEGDTIKIYKTRFQIKDNKAWIYAEDKK